MWCSPKILSCSICFLFFRFTCLICFAVVFLLASAKLFNWMFVDFCWWCFGFVLCFLFFCLYLYCMVVDVQNVKLDVH